MTGSASAPASSGNLGPGFDTLALALELRCVVSATSADLMTIAENGGSTELDEADMVARAVDEAVGRPMHLVIASEIPQARGLGSSSAVTAAAAAAAVRAVGQDVQAERIFEIVAELEGHSDNAAAAVYGGLVSTYGSAIRHLELNPSLVPIIAVPSFALPTNDARAALPATVPLAAASRNIARTVFLVEGLRTADRVALQSAGGDELHEPPRAPLSPQTGRLIGAAREAGALHAAWSGAGPAALALATAETSAPVIRAMEAVLGGSGEVITPRPARSGLQPG